jgi:hypothetical protein
MLNTVLIESGFEGGRAYLHWVEVDGRTELLGFCKITCTKLEDVTKNVVADCHA